MRVEDAYPKLKGDILENRLPPGHLTPEPAIAVALGMSRTPMREPPWKSTGDHRALLHAMADGDAALTHPFSNTARRRRTSSSPS